MLSLLLERGLTASGAAARADDGLLEAALYHQHEETAIKFADHGFRLLPHSRSIHRERLQSAFARRKALTQ